MMNPKTKEDALRRLKRIEGQVRGIQKMVDEEKYCVDVVNQITAIRRALEQATLVIMKRHVESCVSAAIKQERPTEKINELMETIDRFIR